MTDKSLSPDQPADMRLVYQAKDRPQGLWLTLKRPYWQVATADGKGVAYVFGDDDANVRRLVACWNYFQGISTHMIELASLKDDTVTETQQARIEQLEAALRPFAAGFPNTDKRDYLRAAEVLGPREGSANDPR